MATPYFFSMINPSTIVMGALFLIFFAFLTYTLSKVFRDKYGNVSTMTVGIISFCISVLIVYFGKDIIFNMIDGLRLSGTILYVLSGVAVLVLLYLFRKKLRLCMVLMLVGAGLILIGALTDFFYQKWFVIIFGALIFIAGLAWCSKKKENLLRNALGPPSESYPSRDGTNILIREAKVFKRRASRSKNPRFYGGWTHFINYLGKRGYGRSEATITRNLGISRREFINIFNRYGLIR